DSRSPGGAAGSARFRPCRHGGAAVAGHASARTTRRLSALCRGGAGLMLIDSHCHLDFPDLSVEVEEVIARAQAAGVGRFITISTRVKRFHQIEALIERFESVYGSVGTHCHHAAEEHDVPLETLLDL